MGDVLTKDFRLKVWGKADCNVEISLKPLWPLEAFYC